MLLRPVLLASLCIGAALIGRGVASDDDTPFQYRSPMQFWAAKLVCQKKGIVIEDTDYIIRKRYWVLDRTLSGKVVDVEQSGGRKVFVTVRFDTSGGRWQEHGVNLQNRRVSTTKRTMRVRQDSYGDGYDVQEDQVTFSYDIQGEEVDPAKCGMLLRQEGDGAVVRFPVHLVSLAVLQKGDSVVRSWDWHDGFADGGNSPTGPRSEEDRGCVGTVEGDRDDDGFVNVKWEKTGRRKSHRFDHQGYYDIEKLP